jgi:homoserine dehydrogenase
MDVARKLLIVAREVGLQLELEDIQVEPVVPLDVVGHVEHSELIDALRTLDAAFAARVAKAAKNGEVLRYVAAGGRPLPGHDRVRAEEQAAGGGPRRRERVGDPHPLPADPDGAARLWALR